MTNSPYKTALDQFNVWMETPTMGVPIESRKLARQSETIRTALSFCDKYSKELELLQAGHVVVPLEPTNNMMYTPEAARETRRYICDCGQESNIGTSALHRSKIYKAMVSSFTLKESE